MKMRVFGFVSVLFGLLLAACGGSSTENINNYGVEGEEDATRITITVTTADQFGNPVDGNILFNGDLLGQREVQISYDPKEGGKIAFDSIPHYAPPAFLDLSEVKFEDGDRYKAVYERNGPVAQVCPKAVNAEGLLVDAELLVNGIRVNYKAGYCQSVNISLDTLIERGQGATYYGSPIFIPAYKLEEGETYYYEVVFGETEKYITVSTTPESGEIFLDGHSLGWVRKDVLTVYIPHETANLSFGEVPGLQTAEDIFLTEDDMVYPDNRFWALYGADKNALVCFSGIQDGGYSTSGEVLIDDEHELTTGYDFPGCFGLDVSETHTAVFQDVENYQSTTELEISQASHVGCEGDFTAGGQLDCVGEYFYVQPIKERTEFYVRIEFIGPYKGNSEYPIIGRFELNGIQYERQTQDEVLELSEQETFTFLPVGILQPDHASITIDAAMLTEQDPEYSPEDNQWIYTVSYQPPAGAVEACVTSYNQNLVNISSEVSVDFDGVQALNSSEEDEDCHWLSALGNHVVVPKNWLNGYQTAVNEIHVPEGKVAQQSHFDMLYIPTPTYHQLCISGVTLEAGITLNGYFLGWTNFGEVCVRMDKSVPNTLNIEGVGSRSYAADDPALNGNYSYITFEDF